MRRNQRIIQGGRKKRVRQRRDKWEWDKISDYVYITMGLVA